MSDVILVVLDRPEAAAHLLHAAECLAVLTGGARVNALAIRTPPGYAALTAEANLSGGLLEALAAEEEQRVATLEAVFNSWVAGADGRALHGAVVFGRRPRRPGARRKRAAAPTSSSSRDPQRDEETDAADIPRRPVQDRAPGPGGPARPGSRCSATASPLPGRTTRGRPRRCSPPCAAWAAPNRCMCSPGCARAPDRLPSPKSSSTTASRPSCTSCRSAPGRSARRSSQEHIELGADMLVMGAYAHSPLARGAPRRRDALHAGACRPAGAHAALTGPRMLPARPTR